MKVSVITTNENFYLFDNVNEVSKIDCLVRIKHGNVVQCFESDTILQLTVDGKDISL